VIKHREWDNWIKPTTEVDSIYCAKAKVDSARDFFPTRTSVIVVKNSGNGFETMRAIVALSSVIGMDREPDACRRMEGYEPFPELEQARARRRQALSKTD
jgi:hypothetical protein